MEFCHLLLELKGSNMDRGGYLTQCPLYTGLTVGEIRPDGKVGYVLQQTLTDPPLHTVI